MLAINLTWIWDIGWQLSFLAMIAILVVKPRVDRAVGWVSSTFMTKQKRCTRDGFLLRMITESCASMYLSGVVSLVMLPLLWWHFDTISFAGILVMFIGWWIFPLVFSSLLIGLLGGYIQTIGLMHQSLTEVFSAIFFQIPLTLLNEVLYLDQKLSILVINAESLPTSFICAYCLVLGMMLLVAERVGSGQVNSDPSTGYSPLLRATHGAYY